MLKRIAAMGLAAAIATTTSLAITEPTKADVGVVVGIGVGYPAANPWYPAYYPRPRAYYPRAYYPVAPRYAPRAYYPRAAYGRGGHVQRCLARYRTYNPATDLYFVRPGVAARCRL
jgi:hypothetical protein